ncbi:MAG: hypothetical protein COV72_03140 [Candidatus Omnitrophica bacterium CG11_big_fil_rev_8_21_14_0_20_42_13]|uniref:Type II secretion system protein GspC N-terminal domain-containing protein n=1 Tax=Candidatus Ghiorseimicrobium undicola TaxID=1974746 RepID=A0A2H0M0H7_9BACT|nr:MAG: hypothetical protein COV72_03140 [Candidatus Omnitrophica bacterium CG11_big_fil_rev_8_21_14_0_20_42_13]
MAKLKLLKNLLFLILIASCAYIAISITGRKNAPEENFYTPSGFEKTADKPFFAKQDKKDYGAFLQTIQTKPIFAPLYVEEKQVLATKSREELSNTINSLRLVGIISKEPRRAIIEDKNSGRSFHVKEGESFLDGITAVEISQSSVVLTYGGEQFELYL